MPLTREEIVQIAKATADEVMDRVSLEREERELRDHIIGGAMGEGAIPLYGRETRKEPCSCCLIEPEGPNEPENRMCTTKSAIGTLKDSEEREWCSEINIVSDGRCERARSIREAARECKEKYPSDTAKFFACYAPAFSKITKGSSSSIKEHWQMTQEEYHQYLRRKFYDEARLGRPAEYKDFDLTIHQSYAMKQAHKFMVSEAIEAGKSVPAEVLADYPALLKGAK